MTTITMPIIPRPPCPRFPAVKCPQAPGPGDRGSRSIDRAGRYHPLAVLACHLGDQVEVRVVVKQDESLLLSRCGDEQVWNLAAPLASRGEETLHLPGALNVLRSGLDQLEHRKVGHILVPLASVAAPIADFEVGDPSAAYPAGFGERVDHRPHCRFAEAADHAGVDEVG